MSTSSKFLSNSAATRVRSSRVRLGFMTAEMWQRWCSANTHLLCCVLGFRKVNDRPFWSLAVSCSNTCISNVNGNTTETQMLPKCQAFTHNSISCRTKAHANVHVTSQPSFSNAFRVSLSGPGATLNRVLSGELTVNVSKALAAAATKGSLKEGIWKLVPPLRVIAA